MGNFCTELFELATKLDNQWVGKHFFENWHGQNSLMARPKQLSTSTKKYIELYIGSKRPTYSSQFGYGRARIWMDNLYCYGTEKKIQDCRLVP